MSHKVPRNDWRKNSKQASFKNKKYWRTLANKAVRHYRKGISGGCNYKRICDVMWRVC